MHKLNTFAFCCPTQRWAVSHAAGAEPLTCPPTTYERFDPASLRHRNLLYFSLHGIPDQPYWYGADHITAMSTDAFQALDLSATVVFVANCHLPDTPFLSAILQCEPRFLAGGQGTNFTRGQSLVGAHLLGYLFRIALSLDIAPRHAFALAKYTLTTRTQALTNAAAREKNRARKRHLAEDIAANTDALDFRSFT